MNDVKYSNKNEYNLITAVQRAVGAFDNGYIGTQTLSDIAVKLGADCFPLTVKMYGYPTIMAKNIILFSPKSPLKGFSNSMLGSFTYPRAITPCSILVNDGKALCANSCHAHIGKPESVIYKTETGKVGITRALSTKDLPSKTITAIGGMGLGDNYDPVAEGFTGAYADVLRNTDHNVIGYKNKMWYGIYFSGLTGQRINEIVKTKFKFEYALLLDGGGLAAINGDETFARINVNAKQGYAIQFV